MVRIALFKVCIAYQTKARRHARIFFLFLLFFRPSISAEWLRDALTEQFRDFPRVAAYYAKLDYALLGDGRHTVSAMGDLSRAHFKGRGACLYV